MRANCVICSDLFDEINQISAAPCGHVYHSSCLTLWLNQSKTCPHCRARIVEKNIQKLYFNFPPTSVLNSSQLENEVVNLKAQLSAKDLELADCRKQKEDTVTFVREAEKRASELQQLVYQNEYELSELRMRVKSASKLEAKVIKLEQMNVALSNDLQNLNNVQTIVNGTQKDVEDILKDYNVHSEAARQLATYSTCLKRELQKVVESKNKLVELNSKLKRENGLFAAKVKFYEDAMEVSKNNSKLVKHEATPAKKVCLFNPSENNSLSANTPSTSTQSISCEEMNISPLAVTFNKAKFTMHIKTSAAVYKSDANNQSNEKFKSISSIPVKKQNDANSIIRTGYNGLGGHSNFIARSGIKNIKTAKKKL